MEQHDDRKATATFAKTRTRSEVSRLSFLSKAALVCCGLLALAVVFLVRQNATLTDRLTRDVRVAWVKIDPATGETDVEYVDDSGDQDRYVNRAVQASIANYMKWRFTVRPETISSDYGAASTYLGPAEYQRFVGEEEAVQKALQVESCGTACMSKHIELGAMETEPVTAPGAENAVYQTRIAFREEERDGATGVKVAEARRIARIKWQLRAREAAAQNIEYLRLNPLGIEIIEQSVTDDTLAVSSR